MDTDEEHESIEWEPHTRAYWPFSKGSYLDLGHQRMNFIRVCLKLLFHAWMATGTADQLRPFIDGSLSQTILLIFQNFPTFGPRVTSTGPSFSSFNHSTLFLSFSLPTYFCFPSSYPSI